MTGTDEVVLFEVLFRPGRGQRWKKVGTAGTRAEALDQCRGAGDYHLREVRADTPLAEEAKDKEES